MIREHERQHRLYNRDRARQHAGVVAAASLDGRIVAVLVHRSLCILLHKHDSRHCWHTQRQCAGFVKDGNIHFSKLFDSCTALGDNAITCCEIDAVTGGSGVLSQACVPH